MSSYEIGGFIYVGVIYIYNLPFSHTDTHVHTHPPTPTLHTPSQPPDMRQAFCVDVYVRVIVIVLFRVSFMRKCYLSSACLYPRSALQGTVARKPTAPIRCSMKI